MLGDQYLADRARAHQPRSDGLRMLLGRTALEGRALIEPGRSFLAGAPASRGCVSGSHGLAPEPAKALP